MMKNKILMPLLVFALLLAACGGNAGAPSLAGTSWVLEQINGQPILENTMPTLSFRDGEEAGGHTSCNNFGGSYEAKNGKLTFGPLFSTQMACLEPGVMEQEAAYLQALQSAGAYELREGQLLVLDASGQVVLIFSPQDLRLEGRTWTLTAFNDGQNLVSVQRDTKLYADFKDGNISGSGGCNNYNGPFTQDGNNLYLSFGPIASTRMACREPAGVMEQESAYLAALSKVARYNINGNRLTLFDADGLVMAEFEK
jgi:heat shock protein HslJ